MILVVEDEPSISEVMSLYLRRAGFEVVALRDGQAALAGVRSGRPLESHRMPSLVSAKRPQLEQGRFRPGRDDAGRIGVSKDGEHRLDNLSQDAVLLR